MTLELAQTTDRKPAFAQCFNRLAKALRATDIDGATVQIYFDALADLPLWALEIGAVELSRRGGSFFPTTAVWHEAARHAVEHRLREALAGGRVWREECMTCHDTGWRESACTAADRCGRLWCDKHGEAYTHDYYTACVCRATNRTYQRMTASGRRGGLDGRSDPQR